VHVGATLVGAQVHRHFGRGTPRTAAHRAIESEFHEILRANVHLRVAGRRDEQHLVVETDGHVPVLARDEAPLVQAAADGTDRLPEFVGRERGGYPIRW
jgi:hypothetical protein